MNNSKKLSREELRMAELLEAVRKMELERNDLDFTNEYDLALYSVWALVNPLGLRHRSSVGTTENCDCILTPRKDQKILPFTAHSHHREPMHASPDDTILYALLNRRLDRCIHFIVSGFLCRKI